MDADAARQHSEVLLRYRKLVENLPGCMVFVLDRNLRVTYAGGGLVTHSPFRRQSYLGRPAAELAPPDMFAQIEPYLLATFGGEETSFALDYPAGLSFEVRTTPLQDDVDASTEILVIALETMQRKRAEAAERSAQRILQQAVQAAQIGLWDIDAETQSVHYSHEWKQQLGYGDDEIGDNIEEWEGRLHPDDLVCARDLERAYVAAPWPNYEQEFRLRHKDGSYRWILSRATTYFDAAGNPVHLLGVHIDITEKKLAEEALVAERDRLVTVLENLPVGVWIAAQDGQVVAKNRQADLIWHGDAPLSKSVEAYQEYVAWDAETGKQLTTVDYPMARVLRTGEPSAPCELRIRRFDGSEGTVLISAVPLQDGQGRAAGVIGINVDISERKQAENALRESEAVLKRSQAVAHIGHWSVDKRRKTVTWSDEMKLVLGLDPALPCNLDEALRRAIHPQDMGRVLELRAQLQGVRGQAETEFRIVRPDGTVRYLWAIADEPERAGDGSVLRQTGIMQDITERKLRELETEQLLHRLQSTAEQLAQVVDSAPDAVLLLDSLGGVLLTNPKADALLCQQATCDEEGRLRQLAGAAWEELQAAPPPGHWHTLQAGQQVFEAIARPADSGPVTAAWVVVVRDVTIERAVREQLQRQERLAAVGQLAAGIAHDFNNIMSVISVYAEMTSEAPGLTDKERGRMLTVMDQTQRATRMIRQILDFSRQAVYERQALDLVPLLKEVMKLLRQTLPESIELKLEYAPGEYVVLADPTRMQQMVMNLAVNARDAMPDGGVLHVGLGRVTAGERTLAPGLGTGDWVQLIVSDTGTGIRPEHLEYIFEPFFTTKEPGRGTGLGLAQVQGIVAQHEGQIVVASEPGAGTIFTIYLPATGTQTPATMLLEEAPLPHGHGECVLLVEDDGEVRSSLAALLEQWNYRVVQAANGQDALVCLARPWAQVDVILSDVVMPRLGGVGLVKALRKVGVTTPVILLSGYAAGAARAGLKDDGVTAWLDKPPDSAALAEALVGAIAGAIARG